MKYLVVLALAASLVACSSSDGGDNQLCEPDSFFCEQDTVRQCTVDGTNSVLSKTCEHECVAGKCVEFGTQDVVTDAAYGDTASDTLIDLVSKCYPRELFCDGDNLMKCNDNGEGATLFEGCTYGCNDGTCHGAPDDVKSDGDCQNECADGAFHCSGIKVIHFCVQGVDGCWGFDEGTPCDDENICTDDACAADKGCVTADNTEPCDDGDDCTVDDACGDGQCQSGDDMCQCKEDADCAEFENEDVCDGTLLCLANECVLDPDTVITCDPSGNPCVINGCDPESGMCMANVLDNGASCDDANICTDDDVCTDGMCAGVDASACADVNPCSEDWCDPIVGCLSEDEPDGTPCGDGKACKDGVCGGMCENGVQRRCWVECSQDYPPECLVGNTALIMGIETCGGGAWGTCVTKMSCGVLHDSCANASKAPTVYECMDGAVMNGGMTCFKAMGINCETSFYSGWGPDDCPNICQSEGDSCPQEGVTQECEVHCDTPDGPTKPGTQNCSDYCDGPPLWGPCMTDQACN